MADVRFGSYLQGGTGPDVRFGSYLYTALAERTVGNVTVDSAVPGTVYTLPLQGDWDAADKVATLNGIALTLTDEGTDFIEFTVPTPYADGSSFDTLALNTVYAITVDDSNENPKSGSFRIDNPAQPTFWWVSSITGSPWNQSSVLYQSTGVSNGDSMIAEMIRGVLSSFNTDGSFIAPHPVLFKVKSYNSYGWGTEWDTFSISDNEAPVCTNAVIADDELTLTFDEPAWLGVNSANMNLTFVSTNGNGACTYSSGTGTDTWVFTVPRIIGADEVFSITYVGSSEIIEGATGDNVLSFSRSVTNTGGTALPVFIGPNIQNIRTAVDVAYNADFSARFLNSTEYSLTGSLPTGLSFDTDLCIISGTPTVIETASGLVITGSDGVDTIDSNAFDIQVAELSGPGYPVPVNSWIQYAAYGTDGVGSVNSAWLSFLEANGFTEGSLNDRMFAYLRSLDYEGSLADMLTMFKIDNEIY